MTLVLIIVVLLLLFGTGGFYGYRSGYYGRGGFGGILGLLVLLAVLYLIFGGGLRGISLDLVAGTGKPNQRSRATVPAYARARLPPGSDAPPRPGGAAPAG